MKIILSVLCFCFLLMVSACGSQPANNGASPAEAQAAAQGALNRMDEQIQPSGGSSSAGQQGAAQQSSSQQGGPAAQGPIVNTGRNKPAWVDSVDSVYGRARYVAAVGFAADRAMAEKNALGNLVAFFGQSIQADQTITQTYQEAIKNGVTAGWTDNLAVQNTIRTSASMDTLVGAEIKEVWLDSRRNTYYVAAVMEKARTAQLYTEMIQANQNIINNLVAMSPSEKNSLEGFSRYQFAATIADINISYGNLLRLIDAAVPAGLVKGDEYRLEAQNITRAIPVGVTVTNDKSGRIQGAFAKSLSDLGFRSGGTNARYVLRVNITVSPVELAGNANKFARMELSANLTDTSSGSVLLPYTFNNREGHTTLSEAENRTYAMAERKINDEYTKLLNNYLSQLLPKRG